MSPFLRFLLAVSLVATGLTSCSTLTPARLAFPELDAELQQHKKAGSQIVYPVVKRSVKPDYPAIRASGSAWGVMKVGPTGKVEEVKVVGEAPELYQESIQEALRQWQFKPGTVQGKPATFVMQVKITFVPDSSKAKGAGKGSQAKEESGITFEPQSAITRSLFPELEQKLDDHSKAGRKVRWAKPLKMPPPSFPHGMPADGTVWVAFIINESGWAQNIHIVGKCPKAFEEAIVKAVSTWQFEPATVDGKRHASTAAGKMTFRLINHFYPRP